jgi:hypothetical protein
VAAYAVFAGAVTATTAVIREFNCALMTTVLLPFATATKQMPGFGC